MMSWRVKFPGADSGTPRAAPPKRAGLQSGTFALKWDNHAGK